MTPIFCQTHQEYASTGVCRWCEPPKTAAATAAVPEQPRVWTRPSFSGCIVDPSVAYEFTDPETSIWKSVENPAALGRQWTPAPPPRKGHSGLRAALEDAWGNIADGYLPRTLSLDQLDQFVASLIPGATVARSQRYINLDAIGWDVFHQNKQVRITISGLEVLQNNTREKLASLLNARLAKALGHDHADSKPRVDPVGD